MISTRLTALALLALPLLAAAAPGTTVARDDDGTPAAGCDHGAEPHNSGAGSTLAGLLGYPVQDSVSDTTTACKQPGRACNIFNEFCCPGSFCLYWSIIAGNCVKT